MRPCVYSAVSNLRNEDRTLQCNKHGLKVKKPDSEENILNDLTYVKLKSRQDRSVENGGGWDGGTAGGAPGNFLELSVMEMFHHFIQEWVTQV